MVVRKNKQKQKRMYLRLFLEIIEVLTAVFGIVLFSAVAFGMKDSFYEVDFLKYRAYRNVVMVFIPLLVILGMVYFIWNFYQEDKKNKVSFPEYLKQAVQKMNLCDWFAVGYLLVCAVSTLGAEDKKIAFWGNDGWYMGFFSQASFVFLYFIFSRFAGRRRILEVGLALIAFVVFGLGILNRLLIDPLDVYRLGTPYEVEAAYRTQFLSTIGQATWYSSFMCVVLPVFAGIFITAEEMYRRVISGIVSLIGFMTLCTQNSESAYFALFGFISLLFLLSLGKDIYFLRFAAVGLMFFTATRLMNLAFVIFRNEEIEYDRITEFILFHKVMWVLFAVAVVLYIFIYIWIHRGYYKQKAVARFGYVYLIICSLGLAAGIFVLWMGAKGRLPEQLVRHIARIPYLTWGKDWGSGRGKSWEFSAMMYQNYNAFRKIFGIGPDCFASFGYGHYRQELYAIWKDDILCNAHNELLNMLVNCGLAGLVSYVGFFICYLKRGIRHFPECPEALGYLGAVTSYLFHNFFCYQQVCCTPFVFLLAGIGMFLIGSINTRKPPIR